MQVYLRDSPRAVILIGVGGNEKGDHTALILGAKESQLKKGNRNGISKGDRALIETVSVSEIDGLGSMRILHEGAFGCLGLINVGNDLFVGIIDGANSVGKIRPGEGVLRISSVRFYCLNKSLWDDNQLTYEEIQGGPLDPQGARPLPHEAGYTPSPSANQAGIIEHPCTSIRKFLSNGTFYFAQDGAFDVSCRLDQRIASEGENKIKVPRRPPNPPGETESDDEAIEEDVSNNRESDTRFVWNTYLMQPLNDYRSRLEKQERRLLDREGLLTKVIQGYVGTYTIGQGIISLISRLSWKRAGTRYLSRGIDDEGNVAVFAESETLYSFGGITMSYAQVRGSVPLFWEQQGLQAFNAKIQISRSRLASQPAFDRHFADLLEQYKHVHALNLLGTRDAETVLTAAYGEHLRHSEAEELYLSSRSKEDGLKKERDDPLDRIGLTNFDFHSVSRASGGLDGTKDALKRLAPIQRKKQAFFYSIIDERNTLIQRQRGVFRTNCLDCLDRTNVVQGILSQEALQLYLDHAGQYGLPDGGSAVWVSHRNLWAENGDALSKIYAGTGALNSTFTRTGVGKKTLGSLLSDAAKSASRLYINNFQDKSKQNVIDALLGNLATQRPVSVFDPIHDAVNAELNDRLDEFSTIKNVSIFTGTWNLAGISPSNESLLPFLFPTKEEPDVLAIGLQEVVPLTPQQILLTDPEKLGIWESTITNTVAKRSEKSANYIPLCSEQLVGTALIILIKESLLPHIRQVEAATKKTGLKGMSGNKGGVAIRMNIYDTSFCFVTAHFAAGKSNVEERNADFHTINQELGFRNGRKIDNSHHTIWFGDFNYRLEGTNEEIRPLCDRQDLEELCQRDQLFSAKESRQVFLGYRENMLVFLPTYKYDFRSQVYDTSEKMRVPAWTDRILYKSNYPFKMDSIMYDRAELLSSDHRPVFAFFHAEARAYNNEKRNSLRRQLLVKYKKLQSDSGSIPDNLLIDLDINENESSDISSGYLTEELPEPSDANHAWWDDPLSSEEDESVEKSTSFDSSQAQHDNIFAKKRHVQYARRNQNTSNQWPSPASLILSSGNSGKYGNDSSSLSQQRRQPPQPPKKQTAELIELAVPSQENQVKSKPPPPIPSKPSSIVKPIAKSPDPASDPPAIPSRPNLGTRNQSYQSTKSKKSLLDDSD